MDFLNLLWILLIASALTPVLRQKLLESSRGRAIQQIERTRASRVILLVHRQEQMSFLGIPIFRYIDVQDSEQVIRAIQLTDPQIPIDLVLHTPGGLVLASLQIARAIERHPGKVTVFVPHYAMSGGTLIALAADEIVMSPHAVLGPVDPQIGQYPAASILRAVARKPVAEVDDETLILADVAEKASVQLRESVTELLCSRLPPDRCKRIASTLSDGRWTHDFGITPEAAVELGLPVTTEMPEAFLELMKFFPQPVRRTPSVEYTPGPRRFRPRPEPPKQSD